MSTDQEDLRILTAAREGRLVGNVYGRWLIEGEARPDRRRRESLMRRGMLAHEVGFNVQSLTLTEKGHKLRFALMTGWEGS